MTDPRRPIVDRVAPGADFAAREATRPGPHITLNIDPDPADLTPLPHVAESVRRELAMREIDDHDRLMIEMAADIIFAKLSQRLAVHERMPVRIADLENARRVQDERWLRLHGLDEGNGRLGKMDRTIATLRADMERADMEIINEQARLRADIGSSDERRVERSTSASLRYAGRKILAGVLAIGAMTGGFAQCARSRYDSAIEARAEDKAWRRTVDRDIDRLFRTFGLSPRHEPGDPP